MPSPTAPSAICTPRATAWGQDKGKALDYYKKAATAGDADACLHLGQMYEQGKDVKADPAQAAVWYKKGADLGSAECAAALKRLNDQKA